MRRRPSCSGPMDSYIPLFQRGAGKEGDMVNALANAFAAALQESGDTDPLQRLRALVAKFGIKGRPSRKTCRLVVALARRLGVEFPESEEPRQKNQLEFPVPSLERERPGNGEAETHRPVGRWRMPPAAESVIRRQEKEWRAAAAHRHRVRQPEEKVREGQLLRETKQALET